MAKSIKVIRPFTLKGIHQAVGSTITVDDESAKFHIGKRSAELATPAQIYPIFSNVFSGPMTPEACNVARVALGSDGNELHGDMDLYVSTAGNDTTGDGTQAKPFATLAKATKRYSGLHLNGFKVTIWIESGIYSLTEAVTVLPPRSYGEGLAPLTFRSVTGVNTDVVIQGSFGRELFYIHELTQLKDLTIKSTGGANAHGVAIDAVHIRGAVALYSNVRVSAQGALILINQNANVAFWGNSVTLIDQNPQAFVRCDSSRCINGGRTVNMNGRSWSVGENNAFNGGTVINT